MDLDLDLDDFLLRLGSCPLSILLELSCLGMISGNSSCRRGNWLGRFILSLFVPLSESDSDSSLSLLFFFLFFLGLSSGDCCRWRLDVLPLSAPCSLLDPASVSLCWCSLLRQSDSTSDSLLSLSFPRLLFFFLLLCFFALLFMLFVRTAASGALMFAPLRGRPSTRLLANALCHSNCFVSFLFFNFFDFV